jgi:hypothetical protein
MECPLPGREADFVAGAWMRLVPGAATLQGVLVEELERAVAVVARDDRAANDRETPRSFPPTASVGRAEPMRQLNSRIISSQCN